MSVAHRFTEHDCDALGGPLWLRQRRLAALAALEKAELPALKEEEWVYGRIGDLDLSSFSPMPRAEASAADNAELPAAAARIVASLGARAGLVVTVDGRLVSLELGDAARDASVTLGALGDEQAPVAGLEAPGGHVDPFTLLADAALEDAVVLRVPDRARVDEPIVIVHVLSEASRGDVVAPRTLVTIGELAEATVVEVLVSGDETVLVLPITTITIADGAHYTHMNVQELGENAWQLGYQASTVGRDASFRSFVTALGGAYARHRTHCLLAGENGESQLFAVYFGDNEQVEDFRTIQEHVGARTRSELVFKGAVAGSARSVYSGLIHMHRGAKRADATQTNRNLVLSEGTHADSVPNLDIEENDVRCSHASAVGPVDPEQLFYLETRGVPTRIAERLVLLGFFEDLVSRAPSSGYAAYVRDAVTSRLAQSSVLLVGDDDEDVPATLSGNGR